MKKSFILLVVFLKTLFVFSQEREFFEYTINKTLEGFVACNPIDPTQAQNVATIRMNAWEFAYHIFDGDSIVRICFKGYNPGGAINRHVTVKLEDRYDRYVHTIFDGDCTIPHGGSAEKSIVLLDLKLPKAYLASGGHTDSFVFESYGDVSQDPVYFEAYRFSSTSSFYDPYPIVTVSSEVKDLTGIIRNQDGQPVVGAQICLTNDRDTFCVETDANGQYTKRIRKMIWLDARIKALGCAPFFDYKFWNRGVSIRGEATADAVLTDVVHYKAGQMASIILPSIPDLSSGRYYKLARREDTKDGNQRIANLYFVQEENPQANMPYVIFPKHDFDIVVSDYDIESLPDEVPFRLSYLSWNSQEKTTSIIGSFSNKPLYADSEEQHLFYIDESSPDNCQNGFPENLSEGRSAAFRCYIREAERNCKLFFEDVNSINEVEADARIHSDKLFDLQGRPVQGSPKHGVYIQNGKKVMR